MKRKSLLFLMLMAMFAPLAMNAQSRSTLTVYGDNTTTNEYVPIYGYWADSKSKCEFIIPKEKLSAMTGGRISAMKFYLSSSENSNQISATFNVFIKEVSATTLTGFTGTSNATTVFNNTITIATSASNVEFDIPFSSDYVYNGGNLLVGFYQTGNTSYNHTYWTGETQSTNTAWSGYGSGSGSAQQFLPKTTFTYEISTTPSINLPATATVLTGSTTTLTATTLNVTGTPTITYTSSNTSVATVSGSGTTATVTGVAPGTATITASMTYQGTTYTATCAITVEDPSYCTPGTGSYDGSGISNVTFGTNGVVVNNTVGGIAYGNYSNLVGAVDAGTTCQVDITYKTGYTYGTIIWVDWNHSYTFEGSEAVYAGTSGSANPTTLNATFDVPATTQAGDYRMRIIGSDMALDSYTGSLSAAANADPCGSYNYSTCHDYTLRVNAASSCPKPTNLNVTNLTPTSATLNWTGTSDSYNVQYRKAASVELAEGSFFDDFENGLGNWTLIVNAEGTGWQTYDATNFQGGSNYNGNYVAMARSYENGVDITADNWMITSKFTSIPSTMTYWAKNDGRTDHQYDETYDVCVSTSTTSTSDFVIVQTFTTAPYEWGQITIDLSAYAGREGYIAFHHHDAEKDMILIDDVLIGSMNNVPAGEWMEALTPDITNLEDDTDYEWQVQADCGEDGESDWTDIATFHTPSACSVLPTNLTAEVTGNAATLSWVGYTDTYNIQYREVLEPDPTAPVTLILNVPTNIWGDGTGYQLVLDADHNTYGSTIPSTESFTAGTFSSFEYTIPENAECSLTTNTIVVESSASITIPAGVYDYAFLNPDGSSTYWIASSNGNFPGRGDDYEFEAGKTYEFTVYKSGSGDAVDVTISNPTAAWTSVQGVNNPYLLENLSSQTTYEFQVQGADCNNWSASATFTTGEFYVKEIGAYGTHGYYLISSPIATANNPTNPEDVANMIDNTPGADGKYPYDLFRFDQDPEDGSGKEWRNYRATNDGFDLEFGKGYLYANSNDVNLVFTGTAYNGNGKVTLTKTDDASADFPGWNLVGNPFATKIVEIKDGGNNTLSFYKMTGDGRQIMAATNTTVQPMEGVFVIAEADGEEITFTPITEGSKGSLTALNLSDGNEFVDRAIVRFGQGRQLPKLQLDRNSSKLYIPQDGQDYAVVYSEEMGALPVNFKAENNGTYCLNLSSENVEFAYLHLIDNKTGNDVDLLKTPSYSFEAKTTDYESRFKLVFATGDNSNDDSFAFFSNGSFVINNDGAAELQVIDLMGRILSSETINGCTNVNVNAASGVYMLRLINGDNVKVQKVVVK